MSELTTSTVGDAYDLDREQEARERLEREGVWRAVPEWDADRVAMAALLRLLDAERARAEAAEAKMALAWDEGTAAQANAYGMTIDAGHNPYRKA